MVFVVRTVAALNKLREGGTTESLYFGVKAVSIDFQTAHAVIEANQMG